MWKVVTSSNLNPLLKLFFYSPILTNNNLLLKIYCENIVVIFFNQDFILFFFLSFHFHPYTFHFFFFLFLVFLLHTSVQCPLLSLSPPSFILFFTSRTFQQPHLLHIRERERDCCLSAAPPLVDIEVAERTKLVEIDVYHV